VELEQEISNLWVTGSSPVGGTKGYKMLKKFRKALFCMIHSIAMIDPCRKCILRPCCSEICERRIIYDKEFYDCNTKEIIILKICYIAVISSMVFAIARVTYIISHIAPW
jgi:hypothetical protein